MKISIIMVCKNAGERIEMTLRSVREQTYDNYELVVIDGQSTDNTLEIVNRYADKVGTLISEPDTGIYNAMNKGLRHAKGDIVFFLNAGDNLVDEDALGYVASRFREYNPDIVFGDVLFYDPRSKRKFIRENNCFKSRYSFFYDNMCHQIIFYKRTLFDRIGDFDESLPIYADYEFNVRAMVAHKCPALYVNFLIAQFELGGISTATDRAVRKRQKTEINRIMFRYYNPLELAFLYYRRFHMKNVPRLLHKLKTQSLFALNLGSCFRLNVTNDTQTEVQA